MNKLLGVVFASVALQSAASSAAPVPTSAAEVRIDSGRIAGMTTGAVQTFLGIPYAAPPTGKLRWRAPQPVHPWQGVRRATEFGDDCMQKPYPSDAAPLGAKPGEDCLFMNVWRPAGAKAGAHLPVLVWIYGGGNVNGGASPEVYSGASFARHDVVFVSFNWRVGRFGFFAFPELTREDADHGLLANYGYMDSIAALQWVKRNIAAFGGDPQQVTIYGQSAGAGQVYMLLTTPMASGLFARAIIQSGGATERPAFKSEGTGAVASALSIEQAGVNFAKRWGIEGTGADALKKLRALSADKIVDGIHIGTMADQASTFTGPVRDGHTLIESMVKAAAAGREAKVPLLIGSTTADNSRPPGKTFEEDMASFGGAAAQARAAYLADSADTEYLHREVGRDFSYGEPVRFIARKMTAEGLPVYAYRFGYVANSMRTEWKEGPPHATDIPYSMNTVRAKYGAKTTATDLALAQMEHLYWVNFVRTGNPNGPGLPEWPVFEPRADVIMSFGADGIPRAIADPHKARLDAIAAISGH